MFIKTLRVLSLFVLIGCATRKPLSSMQENDPLKGQDSLLYSLLQTSAPLFSEVLADPGKYQLRVIYTQINRNEANEPSFTDHVLDFSTLPYFYPASTVKMPVAALALQKLHELAIPGLDRNSTMITRSDGEGQTEVFNDPSSEDGRPAIGHYIRKIFLVSDNDAFNRLYEFLGQEYINQTLHRMGYGSAQVLHRLSIPLTEDQNRHTNPVSFYDTGGVELFRQPAQRSRMVYESRQDSMGTGYMRGGRLIQEPFDFSRKNRFSLPDLHRVLRALIFPQSVPEHQRFQLNEEEYRFLHRYMSMKPAESGIGIYDSINGAFVKLLMHGSKGEGEEGIRIFNKEGDAYGFLTDVAYIVDLRNNVEFFLSASIYCNEDGIFNDDSYDYEKTGFPFLKNLGQVILDYERKRVRKVVPDLGPFKLDYGR